MAPKQREREQFLAVLAEEAHAEMSFSHLLRLGRLMIRHSVTHGRMAEEDCCVEFSPRQERWREKKEEQIERRISQLYREIFPNGKGVKFSGDPRGYTVKIFLPSGRYNTWGGAESGWGVPQ